MNRRFQPFIDTTCDLLPDGVIDFSDEEYDVVDEGHRIDEAIGVCVVNGIPTKDGVVQPNFIPADMDGNGNIGDIYPFGWDINQNQIHAEILVGYDDWKMIKFFMNMPSTSEEAMGGVTIEVVECD